MFTVVCLTSCSSCSSDAPQPQLQIKINMVFMCNQSFETAVSYYVKAVQNNKLG